MSKMPIGEIVRSRREHLHLTREQLAARASVSTSTIARLELNNRPPKVASVMRIAAILDIPLATLLPEAVAS